MGTTAALLDELREINEFGWNADDATIWGWQEKEGYQVDAGVKKGFFKNFAKKNEFDVQSLAKHAFSIFYQAALFSKKIEYPYLWIIKSVLSLTFKLSILLGSQYPNSTSI